MQKQQLKLPKEPLARNEMSQSPLGLSEDLIKRILYLLGALIVFRLGTHIVIPFISQTALSSLVEDNRDGILGMFNMFSGGALERLSIFHSWNNALYFLINYHDAYDLCGASF